MSDDLELRQIGVIIEEGPGQCICTPAAWRVYGCTETFTCADCNQAIGEEEQMWVNLGEQPKPQWRHSRACNG